mgnify:CR=1 FL=1
MMETRDYLAYISKVIHMTIVATVDDEGLPVTAAIDMMDSDEDRKSTRLNSSHLR